MRRRARLSALLGLGALALASGCSSDPCDGKSPTCVWIDFEAADPGANKLDSVQLELSGAATADRTLTSPNGVDHLPIALAVELPDSATGTLHAFATALLAGRRVGNGEGSVDVKSGTHVKLVVPIGSGVQGASPVDLGFGGMPTCTDGIKNGAETDVDCGGPNCSACGDGRACLGAQDCASAHCASGKCVPDTCFDQTRDGDETDVDCGGSCPPCDDMLMCLRDTDCISMHCVQMQCEPAACFNGVKDGAETDVDCGGPTCSKRCGTGKGCVDDGDCVSNRCVLSRCT